MSAQYDHLTDEAKRHENCCREHRRPRRNRKRYRKPRFDNRKRKTQNEDKWLAPSVKNKELSHIRIAERYAKVCPITDMHFECGSFDTQTLQAVEEGRPIPEGKDFQHGPTYGYDTLREAVFTRDNYTCICCGKGIKDNKKGKNPVILRMHHLGFKTGDRTNRMSNLATVCTKCHTPGAHKPGGKLYELKPKLNTFKGASFMTSMRFQLVKDAKEVFPDVIQGTGQIQSITKNAEETTVSWRNFMTLYL